MSEDQLPNGDMAAHLYEQEVGGALTREAVFGTDPFTTEEARRNAASQFSSQFNPVSVLQCAVNDNFTPFQDALQSLIAITRQHSSA